MTLQTLVEPYNSPRVDLGHILSMRGRGLAPVLHSDDAEAINAVRLVLIFSSSSSVLFFAVVFDSIVASPRASSSRRLSLLRAKWLLAHQMRLVLSTLPVSSALYFCILELRGGI